MGVNLNMDEDVDEVEMDMTEDFCLLFYVLATSKFISDGY